MFGLGFSEVITSSFKKKDSIQLRNALASDKSYLRSNLRMNIEEVLGKNVGLTDVLGTMDTRVFEIGTVFTKEDGFLHEHVSLCFGVRTKSSGYVPADDTVLAMCLSELEKSLAASFKANIQKNIAECNLTELFTTLQAPLSYEPVTVSTEIVYKPFSLYPAIARDIALWVSEGVSAQIVEEFINEHAGALRIRTTLFDEFTKDGRTSYAFRIVFQSLDRTLTDEEITPIMESLYKAVALQGWETR